MTTATAPALQTYHLRPFQSADADLLRAQVRQVDEFECIRQYGDRAWSRIEADGLAFTGFRSDRILGFAGFIESWKQRWLAWAVLSDTVDRHDLLWIHRTVQSKIAEMPSHVRRLEITVDTRFHAAYRWAKLLGFQGEGVLRKYDQFGNDHIMFATIRA